MFNFLRRGWVWTLKDSCFLENRVLRLESCCSTNTVTYGDSLMVCPLDTTVRPPSAFPPDSANLVHSGSWTVFIESFQALGWQLTECAVLSLSQVGIWPSAAVPLLKTVESEHALTLSFSNVTKTEIVLVMTSGALHSMLWIWPWDTTWKRTPLTATWGKRLHWKRTSPRYNNRTPPGCPRNISRAKIYFLFFMTILIFGGRFLESHLWTILNIGQHR